MTKKAVIYGVWVTHEGVNDQILEVFHNNSGNPGKDRQKFHKTDPGQVALLIADGGHLRDTVLITDVIHARRHLSHLQSSDEILVVNFPTGDFVVVDEDDGNTIPEFHRHAGVGINVRDHKLGTPALADRANLLRNASARSA